MPVAKTPKPLIVEGRLTVNPRGFGFLHFGDHQIAFVTPPDMNPFLDGDRVSAELTETEPERYNASRLNLLERTRSELFGTVTRRGRRWFLRVDRLVANTDWPLLVPESVSVREGQPLIATVEGQSLRLHRTLDEQADLGLERCVVRYGIRAGFAGDLPRPTPPRDRLARRDLRDIPTVTIDAPSTTDIDDALAALPPEPDGALRVLVSIADVAAHVPEGSELDREARARGTSVYLAGRVIPMLPEEISGSAASLLPDCDRLALTAELRIGPEGDITAVDVYESLMRSHARLSYDEVSDFLLEMNPGSIPEGVLPTLRRLRTAGARLSAVRAARGGVEMAREEAYVSFDPATRQPVGVSARGDTMAHRLVERLMVATNEAIAAWLVARGLPGLFRVHPEPTPEQLEMLSQSARNFGIEAAFGPRLTPRGLAAFEAQFRDTPVAPALRTVLGKALGPARYTVHPGLHFGLGAPLYLHFTSPIRRYADLEVHRIVKGYLEGDRNRVAGDPELETLGRHLNELAYRATKAEGERLRMLVARLFKERIGEWVRGNVVAVKPFGLVVQMEGTGATGTIATDQLPGGPYRVDHSAQALVGPDRRFAVGDSLEVEIIGTDEDLGRVDLAL